MASAAPASLVQAPEVAWPEAAEVVPLAAGLGAVGSGVGGVTPLERSGSISASAGPMRPVSGAHLSERAVAGRTLSGAPSKSHLPAVDEAERRAQVMTVPVSLMSRVLFEQAGSRLTAVEIVRGSRAPVIASLHRALLALGIVISSYQLRASASEITERMVLERRDGGSIESQLIDATKAAILRVAIEEQGMEPVAPASESTVAEIGVG